MITLEELKQLLATRYEECALLDVLGLTTFDLVNRFDDIIETRQDHLLSELELLNEGEEDVDV